MSMLKDEKPTGPKDWGVSRTKQSEEKKCNINNIIKMYTKTGELQHISKTLMEYRDMSGIPDLHTAMNIVADAQSTFMELPAHIRAKCNHDVGAFLNYFDNPDNAEELVDAGVLPESARPAAPPPAPPEPPVETPPESPIQGGE